MINNVIEICVAVDIAILGIAYPIVIDKISNIGSRYSSDYLAEIFKYEFPHNLFVSKRLGVQWSLFKGLLVLTIISFVFLIVQIPPPTGWEHLLGKSAEIITIVLSTLLTVFFFRWIDKVALYNGRPTDLLSHIMRRYDKNDDPDKKSYYLKTINEFTTYAFRNEDDHIQERLVEFYSSTFYQSGIDFLEKANPAELDEFYKSGVEYHNDLYEVFYWVLRDLSQKRMVRLTTLEHRIVSGTWIIGYDSKIPISQKSYLWMWRYIHQIYKKPNYIEMFWENSHQYYWLRLKSIQPKYNYDGDDSEILNRKEVEFRQSEREKFIEFHHALGGLLVYEKQYVSLNIILSYTQSQPPEYVLLPKSMDQIFQLFDEYWHGNRRRIDAVGIIYDYPGISSIGQDSEVAHWMTKFLAVLFVRQYSLVRYLTYQKFTSQPKLPNKEYELKRWLERLPYFKKCVDEIIADEELIETLGYSDMLKEKSQEIEKYMVDLENDIQKEITRVKSEAQILPEKIALFHSGTKEGIIKTMDLVREMFPEVDELDESLVDHNIKFEGFRDIQNKAAFADSGISHMNFDTIFGELFSTNCIKSAVDSSLILGRTRRYTLRKGDLKEGLKRLGVNQNEHVIIAVRLDWKNAELMMNIESNTINYHSLRIYNSIFVMSKSDRPILKILEISDAEENNLECIDESNKLYVGVHDLNLEENMSRAEDWINEEEVASKVEIEIAMNAYILLKKQRDIVQIIIESDYQEQGIPNDVKDIVPFKKTKKD